MTSNDDLKAFWEGLADKDGFWGEDEDDYIDDDGAVDDDKLKVYMARQEAADERKRNLLSTLMYYVELEDDQEQREFDSLDLRCHRERFRGLLREKKVKRDIEHSDRLSRTKIISWKMMGQLLLFLGLRRL